MVKSNNEVIPNQVKLKKLIENIEAPKGVSFSVNVCVGTIFEEIGKTASKQAAQLIIMGTHGATGLQKLFGSNAMKVITSSNTPFLIVQKNSIKNNQFVCAFIMFVCLQFPDTFFLFISLKVLVLFCFFFTTKLLNYFS